MLYRFLIDGESAEPAELPWIFQQLAKPEHWASYVELAAEGLVTFVAETENEDGSISESVVSIERVNEK